MTHEERLRLIHKPFFITRFSTSYPWGGVHTGGVNPQSDRPEANYVLINGKRYTFEPQITIRPVAVLDYAQHIVLEGCDTITKLNVAAVFGDNTEE